MTTGDLRDARARRRLPPSRHAADTPDATSDTRPLGGEPRDRDAMFRAARYLTLAGMFFLSLLSIRITKSLSVSDGVFAIASLLLALSRTRKAAMKSPVWFVGAYLFVLGGVIASFFAVSHLGSLLVVANSIYVLFVWRWLTYNVLTTPTWVERSMDFYVLGSALSSAVAILQAKLHILGYRGNLPGVHAEAARAVGLSYQPNLIGVTSALALTFALGLILHSGLGRYRFRAVAMGVIALALIFTASVSGMACAGIGMLLLLVLKGVRIQRVLAVAVLVVGAYLIGNQLLGSGSNLNIFNRIHATTTAGSGANTVSTRVETLKNAWAGIQQSPIFGHGLDLTSSFVYYDPYLRPVTPYATHNVVLCIWYEGGILMLFGAAICMGSGVRRMVGRYRSPVGDVVLAGAVVVIAFSMQGPELVDRWMWLPFVLAMVFRPPARRAIGPRPGATAAIAAD
ncbi:MAG TPA: O-antigen ligase family protein [Acidimicrobiales bacterium]|nr:O-antigen ligase family protein [Acidimicrobiales bacterium]